MGHGMCEMNQPKPEEENDSDTRTQLIKFEMSPGFSNGSLHDWLFTGVHFPKIIQNPHTRKPALAIKCVIYGALISERRIAIDFDSEQRRWKPVQQKAIEWESDPNDMEWSLLTWHCVLLLIYLFCCHLHFQSWTTWNPHRSITMLKGWASEWVCVCVVSHRCKPHWCCCSWAARECIYICK